MAGTEQNKTEQPTPFRLQEARKKGQVARSAELTGVLVVLAFSLVMAATGGTLGRAFTVAIQRALLMSGNAPMPSVGFLRWLQANFHPVFQALVPVVVALVVVAVGGNLLQTGPVFSTEPLKPDFSRLNPAKGFKRILSARTLWDLVKLSLKVLLLAALAYGLSTHMQHQLLGSMAARPETAAMALQSIYARVTAWVIGVLLAAALLDLVFSRREYIRKLRMSRTDIKDEAKRREGDPDIRYRRKRLMAELLKQSRSVRRVAEADIVLTNPTHLAVALKYRPRSMRSPVVLAKGTGAVAAKMRSRAASLSVPCLRSPSLARSLFKECGIDKAVPDHLYGQLAPVYRWLMSRPGNRIFS